MLQVKNGLRLALQEMAYINSLAWSFAAIAKLLVTSPNGKKFV